MASVNYFIQCIEAFPESRLDYLKNKTKYKKKLQIPMRKLCQKLKEKKLLAAFIDKSMFNSGEVDFLVIREGENYHIFWSREVVDALSNKYEVENSKSRGKNQFDDQKVIFKVSGKTHGEIEMRNDSKVHYREIKFWLDKKLTFSLLREVIEKNKTTRHKLILYGKAINKLYKKLKT